MWIFATGASYYVIHLHYKIKHMNGLTLASKDLNGMFGLRVVET